jgi:tetratricopeptide (TPR) repeat protein
MRRWLRKIHPWAITVLVNGTIMTIYLWHVTAMCLIIGLAGMLGGIASLQGDYERADAYLQKAVVTSRELKSYYELVMYTSTSGDHAHRAGRYAEMEACFLEAHAIAEKTGFRMGYVWSFHHCGVAAHRLGQQGILLRPFCFLSGIVSVRRSNRNAD